MDDLIKSEGLKNLLCESCLTHATYRLSDGQSEIMWCPHSQTVVIWASHFNQKLIVLFGINDEKFFGMVTLARDGWQQAQAAQN